MGALIPFVLGLLIGVALTLFLLRKRREDRRDLTAPPPRAAPRPPAPPPMARVGDAHIDDDEIRDLIRQNRKIEAIKRMRERTGLGLAEAKDAVEALERQMR
ncbi:ribosomal protein L7/L12 [Sphingopyxis sp. YF1]|uniref:ribosomal protein L7/L12 n=1 Tax=Sphingopyxis sp. YF1 TaxID=2482763 RepID=UPI001F61321F|nr:ribosomal protein L7/L12 [Sphingopyxis sp. YF1]